MVCPGLGTFRELEWQPGVPAAGESHSDATADYNGVAGKEGKKLRREVNWFWILPLELKVAVMARMGGIRSRNYDLLHSDDAEDRNTTMTRSSGEACRIEKVRGPIAGRRLHDH